MLTRQDVEELFIDDGGVYFNGMPAMHTPCVNGTYQTPGVVMVVKPTLNVQHLKTSFPISDAVVGYIQERAKYVFSIYGLQKTAKSSLLGYVTEEMALLSGNLTDMRNFIRSGDTPKALAKRVFLCLAVIDPELVAGLESAVL